ncbi:hypothetical protein [Streptomyces microflavus]|uniref:hypothetical protein n=1 Tax=Streptomyces microflavus TaxID=1919 RepID=UPI003650E9DF
MTMCHGCCCGAPTVPGLDHATQLRELRQAVGRAAKVRVTDCPDDCERANAIVVPPSTPGRQAAGRPQ